MKPAEEFQPKQGEVYRSELPDGAGEHMVVVVSADRFNRGESVMAVPFTSKNVDERARLNNHRPNGNRIVGFRIYYSSPLIA